MGISGLGPQASVEISGLGTRSLGASRRRICAIGVREEGSSLSNLDTLPVMYNRLCVL